MASDRDRARAPHSDDKDHFRLNDKIAVMVRAPLGGTAALGEHPIDRVEFDHLTLR